MKSRKEITSDIDLIIGKNSEVSDDTHMDLVDEIVDYIVSYFQPISDTRDAVIEKQAEYIKHLKIQLKMKKPANGTTSANYEKQLASLQSGKADGKENGGNVELREEFVQSLSHMTYLCRLKYGNLDKDVYKEIEKAEKVIDYLSQKQQ